MAMSLKGAPSASKLIGQFDHEKDPHENPTEPVLITRSKTGVRWYLVVFAVLSSTLLFSLDNSIVADIQPKIIATFGDIDKLPWLSVAFALGTAATTLVWAALYAAFDAKWNYLVALLLFEVGSAICGAANMMDVLIFGRALAGLGGAGLYVGVMTLLSALTTPTERPIYLASIGLLWGLGSVLGPVIGGAFADSKATWRWSFYINLVVAGIFAPVYLFMIPSVNPQPERTALDKFYRLDFIGAILIMSAFCCGITGLSFGGSVFAWNSATTIVLLVVALILFVAFLIQQIWTLGTNEKDRLFPVHYFKNRTLALMFVLSSLGAPPVIVPVYFISLFFQFAKGDSALDAAVRLLPFMVMTVFFSLVNGGVMSKDGHYAPWFVVASAIIVAGSTLLYTVDEYTSNAAIYGYSALLGIGAGSLLQVSFVVAQAIVPRVEMSSSVAFINLGQMAGLVLSLTLANTLFLNLAQTYIGGVIPNADPDQIKAAISGAGSAFLDSLDADAKGQVISAIVSAIGKTYIILITVGCAEFILSFFLKWERVFLQM